MPAVRRSRCRTAMQRSSLSRRGHFLVRSLCSKAPGADHYGVLGIKRNANQRQVKDAFYKLSKIYHPDVNRDEVALQKFQDITAAYETLGTPESRDVYDMATQPVKNQRLSSATLRRDGSNEDDYTLSYKMRKKANEKFRIKTHPESAAGDGQPAARPGHYSAGTFNPTMMDELYESYRAEPKRDQLALQRHTSTSAGLVMLALLAVVIVGAACRPTSVYLQKGHRINLSNLSDKRV